MIQFPLWVQVAMAVSYIVAQLSTAAFVILVLWPSIRNQERRAQRLEAWCERDEVKGAIWKLVDKMAHGDGLDGAGKPTTRSEFTTRGTNRGEL